MTSAKEIRRISDQFESDIRLNMMSIISATQNATKF